MDREWSKEVDWFWEGNVQATITQSLIFQGFKVRSADTHARTRGPDILAEKEDERILVEVKGWPADKYVRGEKIGQKKTTQPTSQARHWFSGAIHSLIERRAQYVEYDLALGLPDFPRYRKLAEKASWALQLLQIQVWFVSQAGIVEKRLYESRF